MSHVSTQRPGLGIWGRLAECVVNMRTLPRCPTANSVDISRAGATEGQLEGWPLSGRKKCVRGGGWAGGGPVVIALICYTVEKAVTC